MMTRSPIVDPIVLGRRLRGARIVAGFDRVTDACKNVALTSGVTISERTLYAVERGQQLPSLDQFFALLMTYDPEGATMYAVPALRADVAEWIMARRG